MLVDRLNSFIGVDDMNRANHSETESGAIADMWKYASIWDLTMGYTVL